MILISPPTEATFLAQSSLCHLQPLYPAGQKSKWSHQETMLVNKKKTTTTKNFQVLGLAAGFVTCLGILLWVNICTEAKVLQVTWLVFALFWEVQHLLSRGNLERIADTLLQLSHKKAFAFWELIRIFSRNSNKREATTVSPVGGGGAAAPNQKEYQQERWNVGLVEGPLVGVCSQHQPGSLPAPTAPRRHALWEKDNIESKVNIQQTWVYAYISQFDLSHKLVIRF